MTPRDVELLLMNLVDEGVVEVNIDSEGRKVYSAIKGDSLTKEVADRLLDIVRNGVDNGIQR